MPSVVSSVLIAALITDYLTPYNEVAVRHFRYINHHRSLRYLLFVAIILTGISFGNRLSVVLLFRARVVEIAGCHPCTNALSCPLGYTSI